MKAQPQNNKGAASWSGQLAFSIAKGIHRYQSKWADWMDTKFNGLPIAKKKILAAVFFSLMAGWSIVQIFSEPKATKETAPKRTTINTSRPMPSDSLLLMERIYNSKK